MASKYKEAGVDIEAGNTFVEIIKPFAKATRRPGVSGGLGGFSGLFDLKQTGYKDPLLALATDGVGTKLTLAINAGNHSTVGIDLVAMCVNDLIVQGAEPVAFLDYIATAKLDIAMVKDVVAGVAQGCQMAGCALVGGETAEMPGIYHIDDYDLAGFALGVVERDDVLDGSNIKVGDVILGIGSSGVHSNGFSLVRKVIKDNGFEEDSPAPFMPDMSLSEALLTPTKIYVKSLLPLVKAGKINGLAHITGGGITDNLPRTLPDTMMAWIDLSSWEMPPVFRWLATQGDIDTLDMLQTFNCGIGMVAIVSPDKAKDVQKELLKAGEKVIEIGKIRTRPESGQAITYENLKAPWLA